MKKKEFLTILKDPAKEVMKKYGLLASVTLGQAALESGWLSSELYNKANNPFGIKGKYNGEYVTIKTKEEVDGEMKEVMADFKKYPDILAALEDRTNVLLNNKLGDKYRYRDAVGVTDPRKALEIIHKGGYATASDYVDRVMNVIDSNDFTKYDKEVIAELQKEAEDEEIKDNIVEVKPNIFIYRVRLSYDNPSSQLGAFTELPFAINLVDKNPSYKVYDENGNVVYEVKKEEPPVESKPTVSTPVGAHISTNLVAGTKLNIKKTNLYASAYSTKPSKIINNMALYVFDGKKFKNNMYRVCIAKKLCNTSTSNVYGYINIDETTLN